MRHFARNARTSEFLALATQISSSPCSALVRSICTPTMQGELTKDAILIIGGSHHERHRVMEGAYGKELSTSQHETETMTHTSLEIDTKYYTASLRLFNPISAHDQPCFNAHCDSLHRNYISQLHDQVDAMIVLHDESGDDENLTRLQNFLEHATEALEPSVLLYIVKNDELLPSSTLTWCQENGFEIVGLENEQQVDDEPGGIRETFGLPRVMEALECHLWTNMVYKTDLRPQAVGLEVPSNIEDEDLDDMPPEVMATFADVMKFMKGDDLLNEMASGDKGMTESFEGLMAALGPLQQLRSQLSTLEDDKRRKMAAQVAMAMMGALGDDDEEDLF